MSDQDTAPPPHGTTPPPFRGTPPPQPGPPRPQYSPPGAPQYSPPGAPQYSPPGAPQYSPPGSHDPSSGVPQHPSPGWPVPPQPVHRPAPKRTGLWILLGALALLLLVSSAVVGWWASGWGDRHPDEWDPAVAELAEFLEEERDVDFDHPVFVNFLDADEYRAAAGAEPSDGAALDDGSDGSGGAEDDLAMFRALGLVSGTPDLEQAGSDLFADGTAAFYDPVADQIFVKGRPGADGRLDLELQLVVLHELAHALQHQVVDLDVLYGEDGAHLEESTETSDARVAVLEGDASLVERAFAATLSPAELDELQEAMTGSFTESEAAIDERGVPEILTLLLGMPYEFGPSWMDVELFGPDGRDLASSLEAGLPSTAQILGLRTDRVAEVDVDTPELPDGAEQIETDTWGAFSWVVPLASYVDVPLAGAAAEAWVGDAVLVHRIEDRVCVDATVQLADDAGAAAFSEATTEWFGQLPEAAGATTERSGQQVRLHTCDPGPEVEHDLPEDAADSLGQLALQNAIVSDAIVAGAPEDAAVCFAEAMIDRFGVTPLLEDDALAESPGFLDTVDELRSSCRT